MKRIYSVLVVPLAQRAGTFAAGAVGAWGTFDPALTSRVEAWATATAFLAVDLVVAYVRSRNKQEAP